MSYMINVDFETRNVTGSSTECRSTLPEPLGPHFDLTQDRLISSKHTCCSSPTRAIGTMILAAVTHSLVFSKEYASYVRITPPPSRVGVGGVTSKATNPIGIELDGPPAGPGLTIV